MAQKVWDPDIDLFSIKRLRSVFCLFPAKQRSADWSVSHQQSTQLSPRWHTHWVKPENNSIKYCTLCIRFFFSDFNVLSSLRLSSYKGDSISLLDDLAFDMYQDPEVAHIIRLLDQKKQDVVQREKFDLAKKLKQAIADLQKVNFYTLLLFSVTCSSVLIGDIQTFRIEKVEMHLFNNMVIIAL